MIVWLASFMHNSTCLSKLHPHDVTHNLWHVGKTINVETANINKNILYEIVGFLGNDGVNSKDTRDNVAHS